MDKDLENAKCLQVNTSQIQRPGFNQQFWRTSRQAEDLYKPVK